MKTQCTQCGMVVKHWARNCPRCGGELIKLGPQIVKKGKGGDPEKMRARDLPGRGDRQC